jgi:hypothetical protein
MREEIYYRKLEDYTNAMLESNFFYMQKVTFTDSYEESLKIIYSLYEESLSLKKSLNRDEKIDIILKD